MTKKIALDTPPHEISLDDHLAVVESLEAIAMALPEAAVKQPWMPMPVFISEATTTVVAAKEHFGDLSAVGYTEAMRDELERRVVGVMSAQAVWETERRGGHSERVAQLIQQADWERSDLLAAADLALRNNNEGLRRLSEIREGEGLSELESDLGALAVLLTDAHEHFAAINIDVGARAQRAAELRDGLRLARAEQDVARSLSGSKELRDRLVTLAQESLTEVRQFANFAFRNDATPKRRRLFTSAYIRRRNRRAAHSSEETALAVAE